ncbi:hypothetical protein ACIBJF_30990 [Streptomyces sp. NPDC050743]|uniref:hypothetical protein n=1 Tax=Streptomyces sp. NPDC050743 TaxID=3365634 RepID=UPI0037B8F782
MTVTLDQPTAVATRHGRDLVTEQDFRMLADFCAEEYGLEQGVADRIIDQALALTYVMGTTRAGDVMAPSQTVDPGWHTLILHTQWYEKWCQEKFGFFLHHAPKSKFRTNGLMEDVTSRIAAAGFEVDERLWLKAAECNDPTCCGDGPCC